jgi:very-short-patch-repair endonuclease
MVKKIFFYNHPALKNRRRDLRQKETPQESILWKELRNLQLGTRFKRQFSISGYVVDFFCPKSRIAVEVEGGVHNLANNKIYDRFKRKIIESQDITILRFSNNDVENNMKSVLQKIKSSLVPSPEVGEGQG